MNITSQQIQVKGLSLIYRTNPTIGLLVLTGFIDNATDGDFEKIFRYTVDGVNYTEWQSLNVENIQKVGIETEKVFIAEINYRRINLEAIAPTITLTATPGEIDDTKNFYFSRSLFARYFEIGDSEALSWWINILEKINDVGLIPNYIEKEVNGSNADFIATFGAIAKVFSYYVRLAKCFSKFYDNEKLLRDFLTQRGLILSPEDTLEALLIYLETYYTQMSKRGTERITESIEDGVATNGELLRLIHYQPQDEFMFLPYRKHKFGWNLRNSSPLYRGLRSNTILNKIPWSKRESVTDVRIEDYLIDGAYFNEGDATIATPSNGGVETTSDLGLIKVDSRLDYIFTFKIKLASTHVFDFNIAGYDSNGVSVSNTSRKTGNNTNNFVVDAIMSRDDKFIEVRCILYNSERTTFINDTLNIKQGHNIIMHPNLASIVFQIKVRSKNAEEESSDTSFIKDVTLIPLMTTYSRGFVQVNNFISSWIVNRNNESHLIQLQDVVRRYLIPYDTHIKLTNIGDVLYQGIDEDIDTTYWIGAGEYCRKVVWIGTDPACELQTLIWIPDEDTAICEQE